MRIAMAAGMMLLAMNLHAADQVVVYVNNDSVMDAKTLYFAECLATRIFARIGVSLKWRSGMQPGGDTDATAVSLVSRVPDQFHPGALAYTTILPHAAGRVVVFADRVKETVDPHLVPTLLEHVLAHEITHVLEGVDRHSETGVMKAHWTRHDYRAMADQSLEFTPADVELIQNRLAHR